MTFGPHTISKETYLAYTRADDSFRQLGRQVWCLRALAIITQQMAAHERSDFYIVFYQDPLRPKLLCLESYAANINSLAPNALPSSLLRFEPIEAQTATLLTFLIL